MNQTSGWAEMNVHGRIQTETQQEHATRKSLYEKIETILGRPLVSFFTSFVHPVQIDDDDADIIQSVLSRTDISNGFALLINSPGGDGLAAERIINVCRSYSGTDEFVAIVAGKAKSAATMICMGSSKIMMAAPSELGPVDPQIIHEEDGQRKIFSAYSIVNTYDKLFRGATKAKGNLQPYIQQLANFDAREIAKYKSYIDLADDISIKSLETGMLKGKSKTTIKENIKVFLDPAAGTVAHGRPIYLPEAKSCGLVIDEIEVSSEVWKLLYELYVRADQFVTQFAAKMVESKEDGFYARPRFL